MGKAETQSTEVLIPDVLSVETFPFINRPLPKDWELIQGGMPEVIPENPEVGLFNVVHKYVSKRYPESTGAVVPTSARIVENWSIKKIKTIMPDGRVVYFPTALLWKYHGKGCETTSGIRYQRVKIA